MVLIVGTYRDLHIQHVCDKLRRRGSRYVVVDKLDNNLRLSFFISNDSDYGLLNISGERIYSQEVRSVWWRNKSASIEEMTNRFPDDESAFMSREWREALQCLRFYTKNAKWVNNLSYQATANHKPFQLLLAKEVGLQIPFTVISNNSCDVIKIFDLYPRAIYKQLGWFMSSQFEIIYTNEVSRTLVETTSESIRLTPGIFQNLINKEIEIRVTIVGERLFAVAIDSGKLKNGGIDWRREQYHDHYFNYNLPKDIEGKLLAFHERANLIFATYDLILEPGKGYIFLECNPAGQWLWLEERLNIPISESICDELA